MPDQSLLGARGMDETIVYFLFDLVILKELRSWMPESIVESYHYHCMDADGSLNCQQQLSLLRQRQRQP